MNPGNIQTNTTYTTSDGKRYTKESDALAHERRYYCQLAVDGILTRSCLAYNRLKRQDHNEAIEIALAIVANLEGFVELSEFTPVTHPVKGAKDVGAMQTPDPGKGDVGQED